jgi:hypothetical protein
MEGCEVSAWIEAFVAASRPQDAKLIDTPPFTALHSTLLFGPDLNINFQ